MLDVNDLRKHITTDLEDEALETLLTAAYEAIAKSAGPTGDISELIPAAPGDLIMLAKPASAVVSLVEGSTVLDSGDYQLRGQIVRRLRTGPHPGHWWRQRVDVTYTPVDDSAERDRVAIELVKLDLTYAPGLASQSLAQWSEAYNTAGDSSYDEQRRDILASFGDSVGIA